MKRQVNGWDERDYLLWSEIRSLPSYGLIADNTDDPMLSRKQVIAVIEKLAKARFDKEWNARWMALEPKRVTKREARG